jgi:hypothetical protein
MLHVGRYISNPRALILAVVPTTEDIANSEALKLATQIDPRVTDQLPSTKGML